MLNACPRCQRTFDSAEGSFCPADSTRLQPVAEVPVPRDPKDPFVGHVVAGKYELRRIVADGGMGRVYEGRQLELERRVAVKILHPHVADDEDGPVNIERFKREAETSRSLDHRYIVDVFDFAEEVPAPGRPKGAWYLVMEYLDGEELRAAIDRVKILPLGRIIRVLSQTAIGLDGAHARGYVHRDMKPDNIFLVRRPEGDRVKVLDFGSVKMTEGQDRRAKLTAMGTTIGSPYYMSPEQAEGLPNVDHRTDVWALGAILFEMTVGQVPFTAPNGPQILFKILGTEPPIPSFVNPEVAPQLDDVIVRALSKKRDGRFASCGALADALGHAFGLEGDHLAWAETTETELAAALARASAAPPRAPTAGAGPGVAMPFQTLSQAGRAPGSPAGAAHATPAGPDASLTVPADYSPIKKVSPVVYLAVAGAVALLGVVAFLTLR